MHRLAGKPWVLTFKCLPLNMHHPPKHCSRSSTIPHGNSTPQWQLPILDMGGYAGRGWLYVGLALQPTGLLTTSWCQTLQNTPQGPVSMLQQVKAKSGPKWGLSELDLPLDVQTDASNVLGLRNLESVWSDCH